MHRVSLPTLVAIRQPSAGTGSMTMFTRLSERKKGKESMFDLVPFAGGWRVMGDSDRKVFFIRERGRATLSGGELKLDNVVFTMVSSEIEIPP
jgi:hypothetical protein